MFYHIAFILIPALVSLCAAVYFFFHEAPDIVENERKRVFSEYREKARELKDNPTMGEYMLLPKKYQRGKSGKMSPGKWGYLEIDDEKSIVWFDDKILMRAIYVARIRETDFQMIFNVAIPVGIVFIFILTFLGIKYFVVYVKTRDDFLAASAHDLTTPLVGMRHMIGVNDDEARILNERMLRLVENIKTFLKLGGKRPAPKKEVFNLADAYDEAYSLFREDFRDIFNGEDVRIAFENLERVNAQVLGDYTMTVQILWNLLGNDLKYAASYGRVSAIFGVSKDGDKIQFKLQDSGPGMSRKEQSKAFNRYYRAKTVKETGKGGFGIGLCTAREFAREMGGDITVISQKGKGCVFTFSIPRA
jgi:signal transduction histidine kinase